MFMGHGFDFLLWISSVNLSQKRARLELRWENVLIARELPEKYGVLHFGSIYCVFDVDKKFCEETPGYIEFSSLSK